MADCTIIVRDDCGQAAEGSTAGRDSLSDNTTAVILGLFQLLTAVIAAYGLWQNNQLKLQADRQAGQVDKLEHHMNDMKDKLVESTAIGSHAAGMLQGAAEEQSRIATKVAIKDAVAERLEEIRGSQ